MSSLIAISSSNGTKIVINKWKIFFLLELFDEISQGHGIFFFLLIYFPETGKSKAYTCLL